MPILWLLYTGSIFLLFKRNICGIDVSETNHFLFLLFQLCLQTIVDGRLLSTPVYYAFSDLAFRSYLSDHTRIIINRQARGMLSLSVSALRRERDDIARREQKARCGAARGWRTSEPARQPGGGGWFFSSPCPRARDVRGYTSTERDWNSFSLRAGDEQ